MIMDGLVCYFAVITTKSDPTDETIRLERYMKITNQKFQEDDYEFYCHICSAHVLESSKHCGRCKRCCADFDHHCIWLNNCIGKSNYRIFFKLIVLVLVNSILSIVTGTELLEFLKHKYGLIDWNWESSLLLTNIILNSLSFVFIGYLLAYHLWLIKNKMTTYQHIIMQRNSRVEK